MATTSKVQSKLKTAAQVHKEPMFKATKEEGIRQHATAKKFGVSRVTMRNRMVHPNPSPHGGKAKLPDWAENSIADFLGIIEAFQPHKSAARTEHRRENRKNFLSPEEYGKSLTAMHLVK
ncbi:hypothetical protein RvY_03464 [Ramazzottius varieornatus]|uniref:HTH psq-type domain-containing protein n=1 Tax=Ramazzottius varieornatus TaxID=947166 RepID=A0A1D1UNY2_RAMVA|nr:hypothetical protein RvY_03464 [Ramazzottius varieornatus]